MTLKILLVEDEPLLLEATCEDLNDLGYEVLCAMNAAQALEMIGTLEAVDLLITDIRMAGDCDGWELARRVREALPEIGVIYVSGYSAEKQQPVQGSRFLNKPYRLSELTTAIAGLAGA